MSGVRRLHIPVEKELLKRMLEASDMYVNLYGFAVWPWKEDQKCLALRIRSSQEKSSLHKPNDLPPASNGVPTEEMPIQILFVPDDK